jgi:hypothetical protein
VTGVTDFSPRRFQNACSCWECSPERKANETHWHVMRRGYRDLNPLPPAPEKGRSLRVLSAADEPSTRDGGFSRSFRRKAPWFFDAPARTGPFLILKTRYLTDSKCHRSQGSHRSNKVVAQTNTKKKAGRRGGAWRARPTALLWPTAGRCGVLPGDIARLPEL